MLLALAAPACGGGDDDDDGPDAGVDAGLCGPAGAVDAVEVSGGPDRTVAFGEIHSSANNDCTAPGGGPTSLTIQGIQIDPADPARFLVLCLPRPDQIDDTPVPIDDAERIQLVDLVAEPADGCRLALDRDRAASGQVTFGGYCGAGSDPAGYSLTFAVDVPLVRTCEDAEPEAVDGSLVGAAPVIADGV